MGTWSRFNYSYVTLGKLLNPPVPQLPQTLNGDNTSIYLIEE